MLFIMRGIEIENRKIMQCSRSTMAEIRPRERAYAFFLQCAACLSTQSDSDSALEPQNAAVALSAFESSGLGRSPVTASTILEFVE